MHYLRMYVLIHYFVYEVNISPSGFYEIAMQSKLVSTQHKVHAIFVTIEHDVHNQNNMYMQTVNKGIHNSN